MVSGFLKNKVAVITGGNSGIGLAITREFSSKGVQTLIFGRDQHSLQAATRELKKVIHLNGDVQSISDLQYLFHSTYQNLGKIDILVASAGIAKMTPLTEVTEEEFDQLVAVNFKGVFFTVQKALKYFNDGGSIILITSNANQRGQPGAAVYSATKAAVRSLARSFSSELIDRNIRVNALSPGPVETNIFRDVADFDNIKDQFIEQVPIKRFARPEEIAKAALFLASSDSSYMVGAELVVDGGITQL